MPPNELAQILPGAARHTSGTKDGPRRFLPYGRQTIEPDDVASVVAVLQSDWLTTGPRLDAFERALAGAVGAPYAVAVSSGTAALHAACFAAGIEPGEQVIVPAIGFLATANCVRYLGGEPVFADVDPETGLLRPEDVARVAGPGRRVAIPVHLGGMPADVEGVRAALGQDDAVVIEDAAHALGARGSPRPGAPDPDWVGSCRASQFAIFSFHPLKAITTGEGGAVTTHDPELARRVRLFRNHGIERDPARMLQRSPGPWAYEQHALGHNLRMSEIQAALGLSQLPKLGRFVARRRALAQRYDALLAQVPEVVPGVPATARARNAWHLYPVRIDFEGLAVARAELMRALSARGIGTQVHYIPLPLQPYYADRGARAADHPGARRYYECTLSLPLFPGMEDGDPERVVTELSKCLRTLAGRGAVA